MQDARCWEKMRLRRNEDQGHGSPHCTVGGVVQSTVRSAMLQPSCLKQRRLQIYVSRGGNLTCKMMDGRKEKIEASFPRQYMCPRGRVAG